MFAMMFAQSRYYDRETVVNEQWKQETHLKPSTPEQTLVAPPSATPSPTPSVTPSGTPTPAQ
jgi:hypothetical protein